MTRSRHLLGTLFASFVLLSAASVLLPAASSLAEGRQMLFPAAVGSTQAAKTYDEVRRETNDIAVSIVVSGLSCTCARFAEDIRNVINDLKPNGIRILPVLGVGGLQNLKDVLFL